MNFWLLGKLLKRFCLSIGILIIYVSFILIYPFVFAGSWQKTIPPDNLGAIALNTDPNIKTFKIGVIGDSTALGQGTGDIKKSFSYQYTEQTLMTVHPNLIYQNFATSGARSNHVLESQFPKLLEYKPDLIFVSLGANNVTGLTTKNLFQKEISELADKLASLNVEAIWLSIADFITSPILLPPLNYYLSKQAESFNQITRTIVLKRGFKFVDVYYSTTKEFLDKPRTYFSRDMFHPSVEGYRLWTREISKQA